MKPKSFPNLMSPVGTAYASLEIWIAWGDCVLDGSLGDDYDVKRALPDIITEIKRAIAAVDGIGK